MSVGRPDPNAFKVITPDVYDQNLAQIAKAKAALEAFEKMNEAGKSNYEKILAQEERELEQKIQEGLLARQRLEQLRQRKAIGLLEDGGGTSRIEEVGDSNLGPKLYDSRQNPQDSRPDSQRPPHPVSAGPPVQDLSQSQHQASLPPPNQSYQTNPSHNQSYSYPLPHSQYYPYSANQPVIQTYYPVQRQQPQGNNVGQQYYPSPIANQTNNIPKKSGNAGQPQHLQATGGPTTSQINNVRQNSGNVRQSQRSQAPRVPTVQQHPSSQVNSLSHPNATGANQNSIPATQVPTTAPRTQQQPVQQNQSRQYYRTNYTGATDSVNASAITSATIPIQTPGANSASFSNTPTLTHTGTIQRPSTVSSSRSVGPENRPSSSTNVIVEQTPQKDPPVNIPPVPTFEQIKVYKTYFDLWGSRVPPLTEYTGEITCGQKSIKCSKHIDGTVRFLVKLPTGPLQMLVSAFLDGLSSSVLRPRGHSPFQQYAKDGQVSNQSLSNAPGSTSNGLAQTSGRTSAAQPPFGTPVKVAPLERRPGTITSPKQADKKRIAQSILFALGKRRREIDDVSDTESHTSKKQNMDKSAGEKPTSTPPIHSEPIGGGKFATATSQNSTVPTLPTTSLQQPRSIIETTAFSSSTQPSIPTPQVPPTKVAQASMSASLPSAPTGPNSALSMSLPPRPSTENQPVNIPPPSMPRQSQLYNFVPFNPPRPSEANTSHSGPSAPPHLPPNTAARGISNSATTSQPFNHSGRPSSSSHVPIFITAQNNSTPSALGQNIPPAISSSALGSRNALDPPNLNASNSDNATPGLQTTPSVRRSLLPSSLAPTSLAPSISHPAPPPVPVMASTPAEGLIPKITYLQARSPIQSPEPVASSSKLAPTTEPLFLPSSPSAETDDRSGMWGSENGGDMKQVPNENPRLVNAKPVRTRRRVNNAYVLVPPAPEYLIRYRRQQKQKYKKTESGQLSASSSNLRRNGKRADSSASMSVGREEDFSYSSESRQLSSNEENEREAIALSCSRLQVAPCRWDGCGAEMNSVEALICHLEVHKQAASQHGKTFMCRWTQCGQQGIKAEDVHMEKHALLPLRCAYRGCDDSFRSEGPLLRHFRTQHPKDELKPSAKPTVPSTLPDLPPIPGVVPSYLIVTSLAGRTVVSKERHSIISEQILKNVTCSDLTVPSKQRIRKNARTGTRPNSPASTAHLTSDYQFLENNNSARSSTYFSKACDLDHDDLDRETLSNIVGQGGVLLGSDDSEEGDDEALSLPSSPLHSPLQQRTSHGEIKVEPGWEEEPSYGGSTSRRDEHSSDEDAAVETMLTDLTSTRTSTS